MTNTEFKIGVGYFVGWDKKSVWIYTKLLVKFSFLDYGKFRGILICYCVYMYIRSDQIRSVAQSCLTLCAPMNRSTPGLPVHHQLPEFTETLPSSQWCHPAISSSVVPFSSCPESLPASESFPISQLFAWGGQSTGASALASFLPMKSQGFSPSEWTVWIYSTKQLFFAREPSKLGKYRSE